MTEADIAAIVEGRHSDPFRILGPHKLEAAAAPPVAAASEAPRAVLADDLQAKSPLPESPPRKIIVVWPPSVAPFPKADVWEVRAFLPGAETATLLLNGKRLPMENLLAQEFFSIRLNAEPGAYRIAFRSTLPDAGDVEIEDPYRFPPLLTPFDLYLHGEGNNFETWNMLGAHPAEVEGVPGYRFAVWAPNAEVVSLTGAFNFWNHRQYPMRLRDGGIWEFFMPHLGPGQTYKFNVRSRITHANQLKADPFAFATEVPPANASVTTDITTYEWNDADWLTRRAAFRWQHEPMSVYEVHLESWMHNAENGPLTYRELAERLVEYVKRNGFTHVELLPIMEYPFSGSWGYQVTGYFAPTSRFGSPLDFKYFVDTCHRQGIGVIVDWVPGHFPKDAFGLARFDGTALYEHADPRLGEHTDWGTLIFNYGRNEVRGFLISNGLFWLKEYHVDGLRVDAVASMLYLDYSRKAGEWIPNIYGGNENLEAIAFMRRFNELAHQVPGAMTIAEESTSFPGVSKPVYLNGLGFTMKWNMGWMHDMLRFIEQDPIHRKYHHNDITFSLLYSFTENFMLPISHDEVVHGKHSLLGKMPGDEWQRFANVRAFLGYMFAHPGKKLLFMGCEIGLYEEWNYRVSLRWDLLQYKFHHGLQSLVRDLNRFYRAEPALYELDFNFSGFEWIDFHDVQNSIICFLRRARDPKTFLLFCCNFTPVAREVYEIGVPEPGFYAEVMNTDSVHYGGSGVSNGHGVQSVDENRHGRPHHVKVRVPPLAVVAFRLLAPSAA